ncbi:MAG: hypothetical protein Q8O67_12310 [Deltaproteobacteria bacterium]|nr:hypothetical protein [Deltaproteobacteria bacterium]
MMRILVILLCLGFAISCGHKDTNVVDDNGAPAALDLSLLQGIWAVGPDENFVYKFEGSEVMIQKLEPRHQFVVEGSLLIAKNYEGREVIHATIVTLTKKSLILKDPDTGHTAVFIHP